MKITLQSLLRNCLIVSALVFPVCANSQVVLTGAAWYATYTDGGTDTNQAYSLGFVNTLPGDQWWDLWIALNPNATSPVNGPSDEQAGISIPLAAGQTYRYYFFADCCSQSGDSGLSLFFNSSVNPGISVYAPLSTLDFVPDSASLLSLQGNQVNGAGSSVYTSGGLSVVLTEFNANPAGTPPGNVCQPDSFSPANGGGRCAIGSFTLHVYTAAALSSTQTSASPFAELPLSGGGFEPGETINITAGGLGRNVSATVIADGTGSFSTSVFMPQRAYGALELFALGQTSNNVGAFSVAVTSSVTSVPDSVAPGGSAAIDGVGFSAKELVDVYLDEPRQLLGTVTSNVVGSFIGTSALTVTIPTNATPGLNGLIGVGQTSGAIGIGKITVE